MKHRVRNIICILLAMGLMSTTVLAASPTVTDEGEHVVQPRFTYIWSVSVGLGIEPNGYSTCDTGLTLHESIYSAEIVMTLQRSDGSGWENVKSWSIKDDGPNVDLIKHWYVMSGYDYQVISTIYVYNENDVIIEIITEDSPIVEF